MKPAALLIAVAFAALASASASTSAAESPASDAARPVRLMSYNIRYDAPDDTPNWVQRRPHMARQIAFFDPDVLGVQEALIPMVAYLAEQAPAYDHYGVGRDDGAQAGETTTLFWRRARFETISTQTLWCSPTPDRPSKGWDAALPRTVTRVVLRDRASGRLLDVRNAHMDHVGAVAREHCAALAADLAPATVEGVTAAVVLMGDFNAGPDTAAYRRVLTAGLRDARTVSPVAFGPDGTFNDFDIAKDNDGVAIDHVFVGPGLSVERYGVPTDSFAGQVISDHFPVVVDIALDGR
ncbi:endonuclease/exonuclease/phosphatase family protein [Brevundimonas sp. SL130]|uniref:endonuclease/exonuclease/phosphatase family protein n=1 Tax=Brevundimonas sp. SL130 TaxID=2995143 RepID=UPI00226D1D6A|nr:endonuclease/exonuclease/phosphatase family protein [Brevundimonas sp. SL130]WAC59717.1 endonuclease/exonuclease/phosphatase family protein [Brevundimonas sp. SL130]